MIAPRIISQQDRRAVAEVLQVHGEHAVCIDRHIAELARDLIAERDNGVVVPASSKAAIADVDDVIEAERLRDIIDRGTNALRDSVLASGNDSQTNLHWIRKMRLQAKLEKPAAGEP